MGDVCYFTLNDNEIEDLKSKKLSKNKQPNTIKERSVATPKEKNKDYTLSSLCLENKACFHCILEKCNNPGHNEKNFPINLCYFIQKPLRINILNSVLNNNSLEFPKGYRIIYNICKFIYTNGNCKNCEQGRHNTVMIQDKEIPYCFSDFQRNESETSIRVGLHLDLIFSENCKNKKINITDIEPIYIFNDSNNYQSNQENRMVHNSGNSDYEEYFMQNTPNFDYSNAVKKNMDGQYLAKSSNSIESDQFVRSTLSLSPIKQNDTFDHEDDLEIMKINQSFDNRHHHNSSFKKNHSEPSFSNNNINVVVKQLQEEKEQLKQSLYLLQMDLDLKNKENNILNLKIINDEKDLINQKKDYSKKISKLEGFEVDSDILGNAVVQQWLNTKLSEYQIHG
jgi:hypothetical protein